MIGIVLHIARNDAKRSRIVGWALGVPGLAGCVRAFALQRFSLAYSVLAEAGLRADKAVKIALRSTANHHYEAEADIAAKSIRKGDEIHSTLSLIGPKCMPDEFLETVRIGEETGNLPEVMAKQAQYYQSESIRQLKIISMIASGIIYALIAMLVITMVIRMYMAVYVNPINNLMNSIDNGDLLKSDKDLFGP
jgi:type II secretory pathway component PulF